MKLRHSACILIAVVCLSSCATEEKPTEATPPAQPTSDQVQQMQKEADKIIDQQLGNMKKKEASMFPCSLFTKEELEALVGNPLDSGSYAFENVQENDRSYKRESCDWSAASGDGNEAHLSVSLPKHFASGKVECTQAGATREISGLGDRAWWDHLKSFGMGTLRACSDKAMLEVRVMAKREEEAAARRIAQTIAEKVLASQ